MNLLIKEYTQLEQTSFKTFLGFSFLIFLVLLPSFYIFSSYYRVKDIEVQGSSYIDEDLFIEFYNISIWSIGETSFENIYTSDRTIEKIELTKKLPDQLQIKITHYLQVAEITDLRGSVVTKGVLYKNLLFKETILENDVVNVTITNGPVDDGFNGEIVSFVMTLLNFKIDISEISLVHNGSYLNGFYKGIEIDFLEPIDLSTKASAVGELLENSSCTGEVSFISSNSFVTDCNI